MVGSLADPILVLRGVGVDDFIGLDQLFFGSKQLVDLIFDLFLHVEVSVLVHHLIGRVLRDAKVIGSIGM